MAFRRPRILKSLSDTRNYDEKGYSLLYNLSTAKSMGFGSRKFLSFGYDALQRKQDYNSIKKTISGQGIDIPRRLGYKLAGRLTGKAMNMLIPNVPGLGGRILRIGAGQASSKVINRLTNPLRMDAKVDFKLDAIKVDKKVKDMARKGMPAFEKIQQTMQALAIANAPDYYALEKMNRKKDSDITYNDNYLSAYSLTKYTPEQVDALMSSSDMDLIMNYSEFENKAYEYSLVVTKPSGPSDKVEETFILGTFSTESEASAARLGKIARGTRPENIRISEMPNIQATSQFVELELKKAMEQTGMGATYGFGFLPKTDEAAKQLAMEAVEGAELLKTITDPEIQERVQAIVGQGGSALGTGKLALIILGGLIDKYSENPEAFKSKGIFNTLRKIRGDVTDMHGLPIKRWNKVRYISDDNDVIVLNDANIPDKQLKNFYDFYDTRTNIKHRTGVDENFERQSKVKRTIRGKYEKNRVMQNRVMNTGEKHPVTQTEQHQSTFSSNPMRHNYVSTQMQIKTAIHRLDPNTKDPETLITYTVAFGGKSKKSKDNDAIRDAFQIEFGGPATDKQNGLRNRTDGFVYTPSLFMFKSLKDTASYFGLDRPSQNKFRLDVNSANRLVSSQVSSVAKSEGVLPEDISISVSGVQKSNRTRTILRELNKRSARVRNSKEAITKNGFLALDKNQILQSSARSADLEMISDVLNDSLFDGKNILKNLSNAETRQGFEKVLTGLDGFEIATESNIAKQMLMQDRQMKQGLNTYGRMTRKDVEIFDKPIEIDPNDPSAVMKYGTDYVAFNQGGTRYVVGKRIVRKVTPSQALRQGADVDGSGLAPDPLLATPETAALANISKLLKGQATIKEIEDTIYNAIIAEKSALQSIHTDDILHARTAARKIVNSFNAEQLFIASQGTASLQELTYATAMGAGAIATAIKDFSKFYRIWGKGKSGNVTMIDKPTLKQLGDTARRQLTEPTFNEFVALLQDDDMLTMLRANFRTVAREISDGKSDLDGFYVNLRSNFTQHYAQLLNSQDQSGMSIAMVGGVKKRPAPDSSKYPLYYDNELDLNDPNTQQAIDDLFRSRGSTGILESSTGIISQLKANYNNLSTSRDRSNALNNIINRIVSGNMSIKNSLDLFLDNRMLQIALAERINPNSAEFVASTMSPADIQKYITELTTSTSGLGGLTQSDRQDNFEDSSLFDDGFDI